MAGNPGRAIWWILAGRRPASGGQLGALAALLGLVLVGAIALAWPWLSEDVPRAIAAELAQVQALLAGWLRLLTDWLRSLTDWLRSLTDWLRSLTDWLRSLTDWLRSLTARLPRFD